MTMTDLCAAYREAVCTLDDALEAHIGSMEIPGILEMRDRVRDLADQIDEAGGDPDEAIADLAEDEDHLAREVTSDWI